MLLLREKYKCYQAEFTRSQWGLQTQLVEAPPISGTQGTTESKLDLATP